MRNVHTTVLTLLVVTAVPSVGVAQVLTLEPSGGRRQSLDHAVPVATVSLVGDIVSLDGGRIVQDSYGEPFVLGTAKLDLSDRSQTKVVFRMVNATGTPIPLEDVVVYERTITSATYVRAAVGAPYTPTSAAGMQAAWPGSGEVLQPSASLTVEMPISPTQCGKDICHPDGFIIFVGKKVPHSDASTVTPFNAWSGENPLFTRAFLTLVSQAQQ
jgi:hypothetical protein